MDRRALITGASSGIGAAFARVLARQGLQPVLVARRRDRLAALAAEIQAESDVSPEVIAADLSEHRHLESLAKRVASDPSLEVLVNNAGLAPNTRFQQTDPDVLEAMIRLHTVAVMRLTRAALPPMLARGRGDIINVSSTAALLSNASSIFNTYAGTKAFIIAFTVGLAEDVAGTGVRLQALCPGWTRTEILEAAGRPWDIPEEYTMPAETVVEASLRGLQLGELVCCPSLHDAGLLRQLDEIKDRIFGSTNTTGTPAPRYADPAE